MLRTTELAHIILRYSIRPGDWVVDATVGNGHDTVFLAELVGRSGRVFGFEIQQAALATAADRVRDLHNVRLINAGHERLAELLPMEAKDRLTAITFNLGYLPHGCKRISTRALTTVCALNQSLGYLAKHGQISIVLYPGCPEGAEEAVAVQAFTQALPSTFSSIRCNRMYSLTPAPELILIERLF